VAKGGRAKVSPSRPYWLGKLELDWLSVWVHALASVLSQGGWAEVIGFAASIVSLLGVPSAVWKAKQAQNAADAARRAANDMRTRIVTFEITSTLSMAIEQIEGLKSLHRNKAWPSALERYSPIKRTIIGIRERQTGLSNDHKAHIQSIIKVLTDLERQAELSIRNEKEEPDISKANRLLSDGLEKLQTILHTLEPTSDGAKSRVRKNEDVS
jgi:hypothetical protein